MKNTNQRILVIGATGMLGKPVAEKLSEDGFTVRVLVRDPIKAQRLQGEKVEIIKGDVSNADSLHSALTDVDGVHISLSGGPTAADFDRMDHLATRDIANAAVEMNVKRVTILSAYAISMKKADTPESISKLKGEAALISSSVPYTIFRATWFMETLPKFVQGKTISLIGNQVHPLHWIAAEDFARMVSKSYQTDETLNKEFYIFGPKACTMGEAMEIYAKHSGLKVAPISLKFLSVLGTLTLNTEWKSMAVLMKHYENWGEDGSPDEANLLLGAPNISLRKWLEKKASGGL